MTKTGSMQKRLGLSTGGLWHMVSRWIRGPESPDFPIRIQMSIAIVLLWLPLIVLSLVEGNFAGKKFDHPLLTDIVPHVRFLVAMPLLLLADMVIDPVTRMVTRKFETDGTVPDAEQPRFREALTKLHDARDSIWPDVVIIVLAVGITWIFKPGYGDPALQTSFTSWMRSAQGGEVQYSAAGWWYLLVSGPLFQVILFRWFWRFLIWAAFLYRVSRLSLVLQPANPDLAGGLGYLGRAQQAFVTVFFAFAAIAAATLAHDIFAGSSTFRDVLPEIAVLVLVFVATIYAPLLFFTMQLAAARRAGLDKYEALAYRLSEAFHQKWVKEDEKGTGPELLASTDPSAMADYTATYGNVRNMRTVPVTLRGMATVAGVLVVPFLPLALTEISLHDLLQRLLGALV